MLNRKQGQCKDAWGSSERRDGTAPAGLEGREALGGPRMMEMAGDGKDEGEEEAGALAGGREADHERRRRDLVAGIA